MIQSVEPPSPDWFLKTTRLPLPPFWSDLPRPLVPYTELEEGVDENDLWNDILLHSEHIGAKWEMPDLYLSSSQPSDQGPAQPSSRSINSDDIQTGDDVFTSEQHEARHLYDKSWRILSSAMHHLSFQKQHMDFRFQRRFYRKLKTLMKANKIWDNQTRAFNSRKSARPRTWEPDDALFFRPPVKKRRAP